MMTMPVAEPVRALTERQQEVVELLVEEYTYACIAKRLGITRRTVEKHVRSVAELIPNPHGIPARRLVVRWATRVGGG